MSLHLQDGRASRAPARSELRRDVPRLLAGAVLVYLLLAATGLLVNRVLSHGAFGRWDRGVSHWFYEHRTGTLNTLTHYGSLLSDTKTAIAVTAVLVVGLRIWRGRWRESAVILLCIVGELTIFLGRHLDRPPQAPDRAAPGSGATDVELPLGHTGAAVALYVGLAVTLLIVTRDSAHRGAFVIGAACSASYPSSWPHLGSTAACTSSPTSPPAPWPAGCGWSSSYAPCCDSGARTGCRRVASDMTEAVSEARETAKAHWPQPGPPRRGAAGRGRSVRCSSAWQCVPARQVSTPGCTTWSSTTAAAITPSPARLTQGGSTRIVWPVVIVASLLFPRSRGWRRVVTTLAFGGAAALAIGVRLWMSDLLTAPVLRSSTGPRPRAGTPTRPATPRPRRSARALWPGPWSGTSTGAGPGQPSGSPSACTPEPLAGPGSGSECTGRWTSSAAGCSVPAGCGAWPLTALVAERRFPPEG